MKKKSLRKRLFLGFFVTLFVIAGYAYYTQSTKAHELITEDNLLDVLAEKFAELLLKTSNRVDDFAGGIFGGVSHFGIIDANYARIGETGTTTGGLYTFYRSDEISGAEDSSHWFNNTESDAVLVDFKILTNTGTTATGTFVITAGTSSRPRFYVYTASPHPYLSGVALAANVSSSTRLFFQSFSTSTIPAIVSATSTKNIQQPTVSGALNLKVGRNEFLVVELYAQSGNCSAAGAAGGAAGNKGKCEEATSTNTGIKPIRWFAEFVATTTKEARL